MDHTPIPDGKTGPFMREPHKKLTPEGAGYDYDPRCPACRLEKNTPVPTPEVEGGADHRWSGGSW